jgi:hypothetical protein
MENFDQLRHGLVKVKIELGDDVCAAESLWAEPLGNRRYRLRNVPFLAYGYSEDDVVNATEIDGRLVVTDIAERSGHSTYRIFLPKPMDDLAFAPLWETLGELGCTYERANSRVIGIDVPPNADVYAVYAVLEVGERAEWWTFEEGYCGHKLRG